MGIKRFRCCGSNTEAVFLAFVGGMGEGLFEGWVEFGKRRVWTRLPARNPSARTEQPSRMGREVTAYFLQ